MSNEQIICLWCLGIICMQLIPWSLSGIEGVFQKIPENYSEDTKNATSSMKYLGNLFQNQIVIFFIVLIGIFFLKQEKIYGLIPSSPIYYYLISPFIGAFLIYFGMQIPKLTSMFMQKYMKKQFEHDCKQYVYNMKSIFEKKTWQRFLLGLFNGFSEELLLRIFLMGFMINYLNISPILHCLPVPFNILREKIKVHNKI